MQLIANDNDMEDTANYVGGIIFWAYIGAALLFTGLALKDIVPRLSSADDAAHMKQARLFIILSMLSFTVLSFNMLHVLYKSYGAWAVKRSLQGPSTLPELLGHIGHWSMTSALFLDFGEAIVADEARVMWTQTALLATFSVCLFMGTEGRRRNLPNIWVFFALSQILPVSFAQNLFYLTLTLLPPPPRISTYLPLPTLLAGLTIYAICLLAAPGMAHRNLLIPTILLARATLLVPLGAPHRTMVANADTKLSSAWSEPVFAQHVLTALTAVLTMRQAYESFVAAECTLWEVVSAPAEHPAVAALGVDFVLCVVSSAVWGSVGSSATRVKIN